MPMVSFILHSVSVTGTICIHRLNGNGEVVVANLIHLHGSFSTILNAILPTGAASITILSESKLKFFTLSSGKLSLNFSRLFKSDNFSESIEQCRDSFIVVDNADNLINDEIRRFINFEPSNQYMLFLRNCDGLNVSDKSFKVLKFDNNRITLEEEL